MGWVRVGVGEEEPVQGRHYWACDENMESIGRMRYDYVAARWYREGECYPCAAPHMFYDDGQPPRPELGPGTVSWLRAQLAEMPPGIMVVGADKRCINALDSYGGSTLMLLHIKGAPAGQTVTLKGENLPEDEPLSADCQHDWFNLEIYPLGKTMEYCVKCRVVRIKPDES